MKKLLLFVVTLLGGLSTYAQGSSDPILTLKGNVGDEVTLELGVYAYSDIYSVDFGDGTLLTDSVGHTNGGVRDENGNVPEGTTHTRATIFKGIVSGDGIIKVYGTSDLWLMNITGAALPEAFTAISKVHELSISSGNFETLDLTGVDSLTSISVTNTPMRTINVSSNPELTSISVLHTSMSSYDESPLESVDVSKNAKLKFINLGSSFYKPGKLTTIDLSNNVALESIIISNNKLQTITLPEGANISQLSVDMNELKVLDLSKLGSIKNIQANDNKLTNLDPSKMVTGSSVTINLQNNQLTGELDLAHVETFANVYVNNNKLTSVKVNDVTKQFYVDGNNMTLATIPAQPAGLNSSTKTKQFHYAPQAALEVPGLLMVNGELDLTSQLTVAKGELNPDDYTTWLENATTTFSFATADGTALVEGTDYEVVEPGKFKFVKEQSEKIHAVMLNSAFPKFTEAAPFVTTEFSVTATPILTLKGTVEGEVTLTFGVHESEDTYGVDFGNGEIQVAKVGIENKGPVQEDGSTGSATKFTGTVAADGIIKVYGMNDVWYLLVSGGAIPTSFDQEKLMNVVQMSITGADVESVVLPTYEKMTQFAFNNSSVRSVDVSKVAGLTSLTINSTTASKFEPQLESIDVSKNTELTYLSLQGNTKNAGKLTSLDLTTNTKLDGMGLYVNYNQISDLKLGDNTLTAINVQNNELTQLPIDKLSGLKSLYAANNKLTTIDVSKCENLAWLDVQSNQLEGDLDLTANTKFTNVYVNNNKLTSVKVPDVTKQFYFDNNKMTFATMPALPASMDTDSKKKQYHYAPQAALEVAETVDVLDLTSQLTATGILEAPATTTFSFVTADGTALVEGTDYEVTEPGKFKFTKAQTEKVHGVMANDAFPLFADANAFVTTEFAISETVGIQNVNAADAASKVYNLQGVEVKQPQKGLYIQNGKKVVLK